MNSTSGDDEEPDEYPFPVALRTKGKVESPHSPDRDRAPNGSSVAPTHLKLDL